MAGQECRLVGVGWPWIQLASTPARMYVCMHVCVYACMHACGLAIAPAGMLCSSRHAMLQQACSPATGHA